VELATAVKILFQTTEALAQALGIECSPEDGVGDAGSISKAFHWQDLQLEGSMSSLVQVANQLLAHPVSSFMSELSSTLACISGLSTVIVQKDHEAVGMEISQLEEALHKLQEERAEVEIQMKMELDRVSGLKKEIEELQAEKAEMAHRVSIVELLLREANERVHALQEQVHSGDFTSTGFCFTNFHVM
jgi:hypothetical protein